MKKIAMLGMIGLMAVGASAFAADQAQDANGMRLFRFDFNCSFTGHTLDALDTTQPADPADGDPTVTCLASARVFAQVRGDDLSTATQVDDRGGNLMSVSCDGHLIYSDSANLDSGFKAVRILAANSSGLPAIIVPRPHHEMFTPDWMDYSSFLRIDHRTDSGTCQVRATPVRE